MHGQRIPRRITGSLPDPSRRMKSRTLGRRRPAPLPVSALLLPLRGSGAAAKRGEDRLRLRSVDPTPASARARLQTKRGGFSVASGLQHRLTGACDARRTHTQLLPLRVLAVLAYLLTYSVTGVVGACGLTDSSRVPPVCEIFISPAPRRTPPRKSSYRFWISLMKVKWKSCTDIHSHGLDWPTARTRQA